MDVTCSHVAAARPNDEYRDVARALYSYVADAKLVNGVFEKSCFRMLVTYYNLHEQISPFLCKIFFTNVSYITIVQGSKYSILLYYVRVLVLMSMSTINK